MKTRCSKGYWSFLQLRKLSFTFSSRWIRCARLHFRRFAPTKAVVVVVAAGEELAERWWWRSWPLLIGWDIGGGDFSSPSSVSSSSGNGICYEERTASELRTRKTTTADFTWWRWWEMGINGIFVVPWCRAWTINARLYRLCSILFRSICRSWFSSSMFVWMVSNCWIAWQHRSQMRTSFTNSSSFWSHKRCIFLEDETKRSMEVVGQRRATCRRWLENERSVGFE